MTITNRPAFVIEGAARPKLAAELLELVIEDSFIGPSGCRATFVNWGATADGAMGFTYFDRSVLDIGRALAVDLPTSLQMKRAFDGVIRSLEAAFPAGSAPTVTCVAVPLRHQFEAMSHRRTFLNLSDSDVFRRVPQQHGFTVEVDVDGRTHPKLVQSDLSDRDFLLRRALAVDAEISLEGTHLTVQARARRAAADLVLEFGGELLEFTGAWGASSQGRLTRGFGVSAPAGASALPPSARLPLVNGTGVTGNLALLLRPGMRVELAGVGELLEGTYYLTRVTHRHTVAEGLRSTFAAERI
jgi:hypothetical protein